MPPKRKRGEGKDAAAKSRRIDPEPKTLEQCLLELKKKDETLKEKDETLKQKDETLKQKDETLKQKDETLEKLRRKLEEAEQRLKQRSTGSTSSTKAATVSGISNPSTATDLSKMNEGTIAMHSDLFVVWLFMHCGLTTDLEEAGWRDISQETMELISEGVSNTFEAMDYLSTTSPPWALSSPLKEKCMAAFLVHHFPRQEDSKHFHRDGVFCVPELQLHGRDKLLGTPDGVFIGKEEVNEKAKLRVLGALDIGRGADKHIQSIQYGRNLIHLDQDNSEPTKIKLILELNFPFSAPRLSSSSFRLYGMVPSIKESGSMLQWCQLLEGDVTRQNLTNVFRAFFFTNVNFHKLSKEPSHPVNLRVQRIHNSAYKLVNKTASKSVEYSKTYLNATELTAIYKAKWNDGEYKVIRYSWRNGTHTPGNAALFKPIIEQLRNAHSNGIVHGDIRGFNLIFGKEEASIIDWDLAGKAGESRYAEGFVQALPDSSRHPDAREGNVMEKIHDWFSLAAVMRLMEPGTTNDNDAWQNIIAAVEKGKVEDLQLSDHMSLSLKEDGVRWVGFDGGTGSPKRK